MKVMFSACTAIATAAILNVTVLAQTPAPPSSQAPAAPTVRASAQQAQQVTVVGCVRSEADYRKSQAAGRGGVAGTGIGVTNEFVLANASISTGAGPGAPAASGTATGTGGSNTATMAYELTGSNEGQVGQYVGRRVEISGTLKPAEVGATGPTGGPTAGAPPRGVDVASQDLKLRELEVMTVRESAGTCPAQ